MRTEQRKIEQAPDWKTKLNSDARMVCWRVCPPHTGEKSHEAAMPTPHRRGARAMAGARPRLSSTALCWISPLSLPLRDPCPSSWLLSCQGVYTLTTHQLPFSYKLILTPHLCGFNLSAHLKNLPQLKLNYERCEKVTDFVMICGLRKDFDPCIYVIFLSAIWHFGWQKFSLIPLSTKIPYMVSEAKLRASLLWARLPGWRYLVVMPHGDVLWAAFPTYVVPEAPFRSQKDTGPYHKASDRLRQKLWPAK